MADFGWMFDGRHIEAYCSFMRDVVLKYCKISSGSGITFSASFGEDRLPPADASRITQVISLTGAYKDPQWQSAERDVLIACVVGEVDVDLVDDRVGVTYRRRERWNMATKHAGHRYIVIPPGVSFALRNAQEAAESSILRVGALPPYQDPLRWVNGQSDPNVFPNLYGVPFDREPDPPPAGAKSRDTSAAPTVS